MNMKEKVIYCGLSGQTLLWRQDIWDMGDKVFIRESIIGLMTRQQCSIRTTPHMVRSLLAWERNMNPYVVKQIGHEQVCGGRKGAVPVRVGPSPPSFPEEIVPPISGYKARL